MIVLNNFPKNKDKFIRLLIFFKEILDICNNLNVSPVLDGSFAVFVYAKNQDMNVNDVDLSCPEAEFPKIIKVLEKKGINYKLREFYKRGMEDRAKKANKDENERVKYEALKVKFDVLNRIDNNSF